MSEYPEMYRPIDYADISAHKDVERERAIRLYCTQHGQAWCLQVRAPEKLSNFREGKAFYIATATLLREDMIALRDVLTASLGEAPHTSKSRKAWRAKAAEILATFDALDESTQVSDAIEVQDCIALLREALKTNA